VSIREDPEKNETRAVRKFVDLAGRSDLRIGCGEGRLTWRYGKYTAKIKANDPSEASMRKAWESLLDWTAERVQIHHLGFEGFAPQSEAAAFDIAILSRAVC
jgi:hypothetical protein